jgi:hypothetical protein
MMTLQFFLCETFDEEYCAKSLVEREEFLSEFLDSNRECVLEQNLYQWVEDTLEQIIPHAPEIFVQALLNTIDMKELADDIYCFLDCEDDELLRKMGRPNPHKCGKSDPVCAAATSQKDWCHSCKFGE